MVVECNLCRQTDGPSLNLIDQAQLHQHLISDHSTQLSETFLRPQMTKNDRWLWSLVDFSDAAGQIPQCSNEEINLASFDLLRPIGNVVRTFFQIALLNNEEVTGEQKENVNELIDRFFPDSEVINEKDSEDKRSGDSELHEDNLTEMDNSEDKEAENIILNMVRILFLI